MDTTQHTHKINIVVVKRQTNWLYGRDLAANLANKPVTTTLQLLTRRRAGQGGYEVDKIIGLPIARAAKG